MIRRLCPFPQQSPIICALALLVAASQAQATSSSFAVIDTISIDVDGAGPHGLAFDGANWHIANTTTRKFTNHTAAFLRISESTVPGLIVNADLRGMTYDSSTHSLFVAESLTTIVSQVDFNGAVLSQFYAGGIGYLNALAYDPATDSVWLAYFSSGVIQNRSRTGALLSEFSDPNYQWTGLAIDLVNRTLLAMETDDKLIEYALDGTKLGVLLNTDVIPGNGQGLAYNSSTGTLYVTSQLSDVVTTLIDPMRVPEAGTISLLMPIAFALCVEKLRRCRHGFA